MAARLLSGLRAKRLQFLRCADLFVIPARVTQLPRSHSVDSEGKTNKQRKRQDGHDGVRMHA